MEIQKTYEGIHFRISTLKAAYSTLLGLLPAEYSSFESCDATIEYPDGTRQKFRSAPEFFDAAPESAVLRDFFYRRGSEYGLTVGLGSAFSSVSVSAESQRQIDAVVNIFNAAIELSRIEHPVQKEVDQQSQKAPSPIVASKTASLSRCCVLTPAILERIDGAISHYSSRISFQIDCKDQLQRTFHQLADLLAFEHPPSKDIQKLRITGRAADRTADVRVWFDREYSRNVGIDLEGGEQMIRDFVETLEEQLAAAKPWYSPIAKAEFKIIAPLILLCFWLVIAFQTFPKVRDQPFPSLEEFGKVTMGQWTSMLAFVAVLAFLPQVAGGILNWIRDKSFPKTVFAIGQGAKRHADKEIIRTVVIIGFLVSLAAGTIPLFFSH